MNLPVRQREETTARHEVVVPFSKLAELPDVLRAAKEAAQYASTTVVIRRMAPPVCAQRCAVDHERLYSELKALQAQMQAIGVPARIEAHFNAAERAR